MHSTRQNKSILIKITIITLLFSLIVIGFGSDPDIAVIDSVTTKSQKYWKAYYSEYTCFEDCEIDSWEETISDIYTVHTQVDQNGFNQLESYPDLGRKSNSLFNTYTPTKYNYSREDLDYIRLETDVQIKCHYHLKDGTIDFNSISLKEYEYYLSKIGDTVKVSTWYGIRINIDLNKN